MFTLSANDEYHAYLHRAMERFSYAFWKNDLDKGNMPQDLHHYTSLAGMTAIVRSSLLWATDLNFMNDDSEIQLAYDTLESVVRSEKSKLQLKLFGGPSKLETDFLECVAEGIAAARDAKPRYFSISFCKEADLLSQWRGYSRMDEVGVCLSFSKFNFSLTREGADLIPVIYDLPKTQTHRHRDVIRNYLAAYQLQFLAMHAEAACSTEVFVARCLKDFGLLAPYLKHGAFFEEQEARLIVPGDFLRPHHVVQQGAGRRGAPYIELKLREDYERQCLPLREIRIGPTLDAAPVEQYIQDLVQGTLYRDIRISRSSIPFRP